MAKARLDCRDATLMILPWPLSFETGLTAAVYENPALVDHNARMTAIGRNGLMEDLDGITIFLASQASDYITGQVIHLDGGYTAK